MYFVKPGFDSSDQGGPYRPQNDNKNENEYPPAVYSTYPQGATSAPAASTHSADYFSYPAWTPDQQQGMAHHNLLSKGSMRNTSGKIRHRSQLSQSYRPEVDLGMYDSNPQEFGYAQNGAAMNGAPHSNLGVNITHNSASPNINLGAPPVHQRLDQNVDQNQALHHLQNHQGLQAHPILHSQHQHPSFPRQHTPNASRLNSQPLLQHPNVQLPTQTLSPKKRGKSKPSMHLALDNLHAPPALYRFQLQMVSSAHSDSSLELSDMRISDTDLLYQDNDNVTPLMNPPHAEAGYFGLPSANENDFSGYFGHLTAAPREGNRNSENNSDMENYINFPMEEFDPLDLPEELSHHQAQHHTHFHHDQGPYQQTHEQLSREQHESYNFEKQPPMHSPPMQLQYFYSERPMLERSISEQSALKAEKKSKKKKMPKGSVCNICERFISRDFSRHMRIHDEIGRFRCVFPSSCNHRSGKFNRPYDYKKHLLNMHFKFDSPKAKAAPNLTEKLQVWGSCGACGQQFTGNDWLEHHVLTSDLVKRCPELSKNGKLLKEEMKRMDQLEQIDADAESE